MSIEEIKEKALALNSKDSPIIYSIEDNRIIGIWNWMNATFVGINSISKENKEFKYIVTLLDGNKYKESDNSSESRMSFSNGKIGFSAVGTSGYSVGKNITIGIGRNSNSNESGIIKFDFDTNKIKNPIRNLLKESGWKKKGLF